MSNFLTEDKELKKILSKNKSSTVEILEQSIIIPPFSKQYEKIHIPSRFLQVVATHIVAPYLKENIDYKPPMYLAIKGVPGEGKTAQAIATGTQKGFYVFYISASTLSGSHEDEAKQKLELIYQKACEYSKKTPTTIVIDDFHKSIVNDDDNKKKTINTDLLTGYMMNLAEHNGRLQIPIILTANSLVNVYAPLLRVGRTDIFEWKPTYEEKKDIVFFILSSFVLENNKKRFEKFFDIFCNESIAFFVQLKNQWRKSVLGDLIKSVKIIDSNSLLKINNAILSSQQHLTYSTLTSIAYSVKEERGGL